MRLCDAIIAHAAGPAWRAAADALQSPECGRFDIGNDVIEAANQVADSKPSSIVAALPLARPPHRVTWLEWLPWSYAVESGARRHLRPGQTDVVPKRQGWLVHANPQLWVAHPFILLDGDQPVPAPFVATVEMVAPTAIEADDAEGVAALARERDAILARDDLSAETRRKLAALDRAELAAAARLGRLLACADTLGTRVWNSHDIGRARELVAVLLLLNSRNAADVGAAPDLGKLNRARQKSGKPPLVRGHFKMRHTGLFWWSPHVRGAEQANARDYRVKGVPAP